MRVFSQPPGIQHLDNDFSTDSSTREILNCQETDDIQIFNYYNFRHCMHIQSPLFNAYYVPFFTF